MPVLIALRSSWRRTGARPIAAGPGVVVLALFLVVAACGDGSLGSKRGGDLSALPTDSRTFDDQDELLAGYWQRPIPLQGSAPEGLSALENSLQPSACGACHAEQYADWQTSIHGGAYSPGLSGQLVNWEANWYQSVRDCLVCHAPLSEQSAQVPDTVGNLTPNPVFDRALQDHGLVCAACHVRGWRRYGPPRRDGSVVESPAGSPHGGVKRSPFFEDSRFCSGCHQFAAPAPNGKSLQNTYDEWRNSRYAAEGVSCQSCHMPDRRHLWRGVHDSTMVRSGVTIELSERLGSRANRRVVELRITNSGTGHRFPTYVTPEVWVHIEFLDADGRVIDGAGVESLIRRRVEARSGAWVELSDTRIPPDGSLTVTAEIGDSDARLARGTVTVYPDAFYQGVFAGMLSGALSDTSRALISEAHRRARRSSFKIFDETVSIR